MSYALLRQIRRTALLSQQIRTESTMTNLTQEAILFRPPFTQWGKVIREAEKIVGYPTSFMNLRWLLSDEFANLAMHLRKVVDTNHPIIKTAKSVIYNEHNNLQPWGLVILLLSKAVTPSITDIKTSQITENQRILAELTEMIRTGHYVHRGLLNISLSERATVADTTMFANKIAILIGDYLLVTANGMLARLKNQDLSYLISTALRDISEGEFFGERDSQNMPLPGKPISKLLDNFHINSDTLPLDVTDTLGSPIREWTLRTLYSGGSLFGRGCQGAVLLGGRGLEEQEIAYLFGCHLSLAWQAANELQRITSDTKESYSLVSAPVLFALYDNPDLYDIIEKGKENITNIDLEDFKLDILRTDAVERTRLLYTENANKAKAYAEMFGDNEPVDTIKRLINTI
ncbi:all trans-polyprenyl-diphosphate synthase PDSS2-like [Galleria mellonella]|uniref:All trans-polyprenyl-diphosphate synthase PDSS2-like n=1 Tax=Galleria mellonella TaxID=7137 RepID=A0A6J1WDA3_GALME|nr:all trans-polyprenyl-diphosphate synthase PDSS2-like [Galleria mellonella]